MPRVLSCVQIQLPDNGKETGILPDAVVARVLQPIEHIPALGMLRELVEILAGLGIDQLIGENGGERLSVIVCIR